mmetsp:Transcript_13123/g.40777  ORF Transcript_13123/g.40777 Transcript_13123/m.40777 type:complete len:307 (+) Transcript_13123:589-1509(+)
MRCSGSRTPSSSTAATTSAASRFGRACSASSPMCARPRSPRRRMPSTVAYRARSSTGATATRSRTLARGPALGPRPMASLGGSGIENLAICSDRCCGAGAGVFDDFADGPPDGVSAGLANTRRASTASDDASDATVAPWLTAVLCRKVPPLNSATHRSSVYFAATTGPRKYSTARIASVGCWISLPRTSLSAAVRTVRSDSPSSSGSSGPPETVSFETMADVWRRTAGQWARNTPGCSLARLLKTRRASSPGSSFATAFSVRAPSSFGPVASPVVVAAAAAMAAYAPPGGAVGGATGLPLGLESEA